MTARAPGVHSMVESSAPTESLEELYRRHVAFVWRTLRRFGTPEEALEDLVHDVFLIARDTLARRDARVAPTTWLFGVARNVASNARRRQQRATRRASLAPVPGGAPSPEESALRGEAVELLEAFLAGLDPDQRAVFELCDIEGLSGPEAAGLLDVNLNVAYSRLRLARRRLEQFVDARKTGGSA